MMVFRAKGAEPTIVGEQLLALENRHVSFYFGLDIIGKKKIISTNFLLQKRITKSQIKGDMMVFRAKGAEPTIVGEHLLTRENRHVSFYFGLGIIGKKKEHIHQKSEYVLINYKVYVMLLI